MRRCLAYIEELQAALCKRMAVQMYALNATLSAQGYGRAMEGLSEPGESRFELLAALCRKDVRIPSRPASAGPGSLRRLTC